MYSIRSGLILGFHGCDKSVAEKIVTRQQDLLTSNNDYDWLGHGMYFWENSPSRAFEYAHHLSKHPLKSKPSITEPAVLGAVIDLGFCLDLLDYENIKLLKIGYEILIDTYNKSGLNLPDNKPIKETKDLIIRKLDCAVIETLHKISADKEMKPFDSVRGVFWEGEDIYPNAGFKEKNHIQLCIINPNCIKGYFIPRRFNSSYHKV